MAMNRSEYQPPSVVTLAPTEIMEVLGPSLSCTGFGGSASGC